MEGMKHQHYTMAWTKWGEDAIADGLHMRGWIERARVLKAGEEHECLATTRAWLRTAGEVASYHHGSAECSGGWRNMFVRRDCSWMWTKNASATIE